MKVGDQVMLKPGVSLGYKHPTPLYGKIVGFGYSGGQVVTVRWDNSPHTSGVRPDELIPMPIVDRLAGLAEGRTDP